MNALHPLRSAMRAPRATSRGFSLVEIMVGLAIAMVGVLIMMEVLITAERQNVSTTSGNDAMSTGAVMLHLLERDLVQAGYGINSTSLFGCNLTLATGPVVPLAPVLINPATTLLPAGDANTDRLLVFYGNDVGQPEGNLIFGGPAAPVAPQTGVATYSMQAASTFHIGDRVVIYPNSCGAGLSLATVTYVDNLTVTTDTSVAGALNGTMYNMGRSPKIVGYRIHNAALESCDYLASDCRTNGGQWIAVGANVVSLRAQYGSDTLSAHPAGIVDTWSQTTPTTACGWVRTAAVRLVVVARSDSYETKIDSTTKQRTCDTVTAAAPAWKGASGASANPVDLTSYANWGCYRYRTFENTAPTRNIIFMGTESGC